MGERLVYLNQSLRAMELDDHITPKKVLTDEECEVIGMVHKVLKPFKSDILVLEGNNYTTSHLLQQ